VDQQQASYSMVQGLVAHPKKGTGGTTAVLALCSDVAKQFELSNGLRASVCVSKAKKPDFREIFRYCIQEN
jgi:hypothetical protein